MNKTLVILKREYLTRVRTKAFVIGTLLTPILMLVLTILPGFLATRGGGERHVTVLDQSGDPGLYDAIKEELAGSPEEGGGDRRRGTSFVTTRVVVQPGANLEEVAKPYKEQVQKDSNSAYLILRPGVLESVVPEYYAKNTSDFSISAVGRAVSKGITHRRLEMGGIAADKVDSYLKSVDMKELSVDPEGNTKEESGLPGFIVAFVMLFFIYMTILMYGITVMRGVMEEKQSRIVEVIASSVKPTQMMMGKLVGIGLVGLTQYTIWVGSAAALTAAGASMVATQGFKMPTIPVSLLIYFVAFFVLGYFLYATLYAMVGAICATEEEAQQAQMPVTMVIIVPMLLFPMVMNNPSSGVSIVLSLVPFFAPTLMMMRIGLVGPPLWQILLSMGGMVVAILIAVWVAARIYRVGILMYGKRPSMSELGRWLRYT
jgi:ABC-2 type transport system permease protein